MPIPATSEDLLTLVRKSGVVETHRLDAFLAAPGTSLPPEPGPLGDLLVEKGLLTPFHKGLLLQGKWRGFILNKYRILERLGSGGMGIVYLGEHKQLHRLVAIKVLPGQLAEDPWFLDNFYHEAQIAAALDHPHIVRVHDIDEANGLHFLVMEFVDGVSLQTLIDKGPIDILRAVHYIRQAAIGLQHAYGVGMVHRDIKPGNLLLDRQGNIKVLDMGLACFAAGSGKKETEANSEKHVVGTDDYLAPEQIVDSDDVDVRADIYSLGATFYALLTGAPPFYEGPTGYQKLLRHLGRSAKPVRELRPQVPEALAALVTKMIAKNPWVRPQTPAALVEALTPWTKRPIPPPPASEMPQWCLAIRQIQSEKANRGSNLANLKRITVAGSGSGSQVASSSSAILADSQAAPPQGSTATGQATKPSPSHNPAKPVEPPSPSDIRSETPPAPAPAPAATQPATPKDPGSRYLEI